MKKETNVLPLTDGSFAELKEKMSAAQTQEEKADRAEPNVIRTEPIFLNKLYELLGKNYEATGKELFMTGGAVAQNLSHPDGAKATIELAAKGLYLSKTSKKNMVVVATMPTQQAQALTAALADLEIQFTCVEV